MEETIAEAIQKYDNQKSDLNNSMLKNKVNQERSKF